MSKGIKLTKLNDSNPTAHNLAPSCLSGRYTADARGPKEARELIADFINKRDNRTNTSIPSKLNPDQLYVLSSTSQAYAWLMMLLCDAGDAVIGPTPGYPLIESIARLQCVNAIPYPLHYDGSWTIDLPRVRELIENKSLRIK
ncbi:MAG: aminotransferase class I/II-fold pyridoxal phosphate-dependent enzyme [Lactobacillus iners]|nr:aminotransferase class I/II-fold pyridoxal phosphate-dependent enzyme [Lactobacillus iners]